MKLDEYLKNHPKTHLVFDFDETIATLVLPWSKLKEKLDVEFRKISPEVEKRCKTWDWSEYNTTIKKYGPDVRSAINNLYQEFETKYFKELKPNLGLIEFIRNNHSKYVFYIWTNNRRSTMEKALKVLKLDKYFEKLLTASDVILYKPDPIGFTQIYDPSIKKDKYLMVGDSEGDKTAAKNAGIDFYQVNFT